MLRVAAKHGVDGETVREEIGKALRTGEKFFKCRSPRVLECHPRSASDKEIVQCIAALLLGSAVEEQN